MPFSTINVDGSIMPGDGCPCLGRLVGIDELLSLRDRKQK
jgi:hypothetical protein